MVCERALLPNTYVIRLKLFSETECIKCHFSALRKDEKRDKSGTGAREETLWSQHIPVGEQGKVGETAKLPYCVDIRAKYRLS
jgi:hypothetical protein